MIFSFDFKNKIELNTAVELKIYSRTVFDTVVMANGRYYITKLPGKYREGDKLLAVAESVNPVRFKINRLRYFRISDKTISVFLANNSVSHPAGIKLCKVLIDLNIPVSLGYVKALLEKIPGDVTDENEIIDICSLKKSGIDIAV